MTFKRIVVDRRKKGSSVDSGILYLVVFELEDKCLVKIGITSRSIEDRVTEILTSIFKVYRYFPYARPKRYKTTTGLRAKEAILHKHFSDRKYTTDKKFGGYTEFFDIPIEEAVRAYEDVLEGNDITG